MVLNRPFSLRGWQRGDTIIEVMFATAVAALVIITATILMNRSLAQVQLAVEVTFAREAIDSQAEALRYFRDQYTETADDSAPNAAEWLKVLGQQKDQASNFGTCPSNTATQYPDKSLYIAGIAQNDGNFSPGTPGVATSLSQYPATFPKAGEGIWVEAVKGNTQKADSPKYIDLHIRACWDPPFNSNGIKATLGTIVRLYYERGKNLAVTPTGAPTVPPVGSATMTGSNANCTRTESSACSRNGSSLYSCGNYVATFNPTNLIAGNYKLTLNFSDFEDSPCGTVPPASLYKYNLNISVDGQVQIQNFQLNPVSSRQNGEITFSLSNVKRDSAIAIEWTNNHFVASGGNPYAYDPDFMINSIKLEHQP